MHAFTAKVAMPLFCHCVVVVCNFAVIFASTAPTSTPHCPYTICIIVCNKTFCNLFYEKPLQICVLLFLFLLFVVVECIFWAVLTQFSFSCRFSCLRTNYILARSRIFFCLASQFCNTAFATSTTTFYRKGLGCLLLYHLQNSL